MTHRVLFVCTGNICRSPTAEGVARAIVEKQGIGHLFDIDSAGTQGYHVGHPPDRRTVAAAAKRGYRLADLRARQFNKASDFARFDHILALDQGHLDWLQQYCPPEYRHKLRLLMSYAANETGDEVPDPYYGTAQDFERVLDLVEAAVKELLAALAAGK